MDIVITQWALDSYLDLKHSNSISNQDYSSVIRPDVLLLKIYPTTQSFRTPSFGQLLQITRATEFQMDIK